MVTLSVAGMTCQNCVKHVTHALEGVPGVEQVAVDLESGTARVQGNPDVQALVAAVQEEGYEAKVA